MGWGGATEKPTRGRFEWPEVEALGVLGQHQVFKMNALCVNGSGSYPASEFVPWVVHPARL